MAAKTRKKSATRAKSVKKWKIITKKRSTRRKKDFLDKCLDIFN